MPPHPLKNQTFNTTPLSQKFKCFDTGRLPDTNIQVRAEERRDNMMKDCPDCTIVMSLDQFLTDVLFVDAQADLKRSQAKVAEIHFLLAADLKKQGLTEKDYSIAWVCLDTLYLGSCWLLTLAPGESRRRSPAMPWLLPPLVRRQVRRYR